MSSIFKIVTTDHRYPQMLTLATDADDARRIASGTYNSWSVNTGSHKTYEINASKFDKFYQDENNAQCVKLQEGVDYQFEVQVNDRQQVISIDSVSYGLTIGVATKMEITFSDWLLAELTNNLHLQFEDDVLMARHQDFEAKDKNTYNFLVRTKDLKCRIYISETALEDAINFRRQKPKPSIYDSVKLKKLSDAIKNQLGCHGDFKLVAINDIFKIVEIS